MWRLLDHGPGPPHWNMAVDEVLRRSYAEVGGPPTLRFYQWSQPTLSLGAGQKLPALLTRQKLAALGLAVVRRPTGGRAVLHGGDLTYCLVAGERDGFEPSVGSVYRRLSRALQRGLTKLGVLTASGLPDSRNRQGFSCFANLARGDLAWQGKKLVGSAQSWQAGSFLQHGAIVLTPQQEQWHQILALTGSDHQLPITSLQEILGEGVTQAVLRQALLQGFQEELGGVWQEGDFTPWEEEVLAADYGFSRYHQQCPVRSLPSGGSTPQ